ncbi:hypothetical protein RBI81_18570 [Enterobacter roggenkampii]|uniref:hypothetical protein n=1 Tax=Enterobacteriaceae TaxID=543 RepID=UPI000642A75A|nr:MULTISPECIES: hypothetical protein [Enterobacteriaceae]EME8856571.1 hypothetical protein [Klebsiella aerogenes]ELN9572213.1 hypothetical protein [Enterobacter roggenkampii]ELT9730305.1 hypothetical protein [Klebsiella michiganensis]KLQ40581.1 hypothetical protein ABR32_09430 [Enterobacter cloacae subsp. dissolvens]MBL0792955.1 hypothetical protein [Klebsiella michiganensis]
MSLQVLRDSVQRRKPISFHYNKPGKTPGERIGNVHAIYILRKKDGSESTKLDIVQTSGVTDSEPDFPEFRRFDIEYLSNIIILEGEPQFPIDDKYNPEYDGYKNVIAKV